MKILRLPCRPWSLLALGLVWAVALALPMPLSAAEGGKVDVYEREYMLRQLSSHEAEVLLWDQCPKPPTGVCRVRGTGLRDGVWVIVVYADDATHARIARALAAQDVLPATHAFQVVLLLADRQTGGIPKELPANTQKALQDVVGFLPFTRFRVLDSGWVRTAGDGQLLLGGLAGPPIQVTLELGRRGGDQMYMQGFQVAAPIVPPSYDPKDAKNPPHWPMRILINTAFGIRLGETLVVGTSRLDGGDEALVALVSAVE